MTSPKITVFMAAYNAEDYISASIKSVLNQTFSDFELLIVNDGSTDKTVDVIEQFDDKRIRLVHNEQNLGLTFTRNRLLELDTAELIAILDSDDLAHPNRLEHQYRFFKENPAVALCGGHAKVIDENGSYTGLQYIEPTDDSISIFMLFGNPFINSATMFKRTIFTALGGYRDFAPAEDFDLFVRISRQWKIANIDKFLVDYRIHLNNSSVSGITAQQKNEKLILESMQERLGMETSRESVDLHFDLFKRVYKLELTPGYLNFLIDLKSSNLKTQIYPKKDFEYFLFQKAFEIIQANKNQRKALYFYFNSGLFAWKYFQLKQFKRCLKRSLFGF